MNIYNKCSIYLRCLKKDRIISYLIIKFLNLIILIFQKYAILQLLPYRLLKSTVLILGEATYHSSLM